ncbi:MAG: FeoB-associated Cys-rich membrane protein [Treponema sp.]|nr:FeoB-associated Cys-rich membrane protein [Treponema sp.]
MISTIIICAVLALIVAAIIRSLFKKHRTGQCSCGCSGNENGCCNCKK